MSSTLVANYDLLHSGIFGHPVTRGEIGQGTRRKLGGNFS